MNNMSNLAYRKVLETADETKSSIGLETLLVLLRKFEGAGGMNGTTQDTHDNAIAAVQKLLDDALKAEAS